MRNYSYDLHMHSCLSPCGDEEMTPNNIVNMAALKGLELIALTDHNSCGNCRATAQVAQGVGLAFLPGMELCTSEEIHVVCLFPTCDQAEAFDAYVHERILPIVNRPDIFGRQVLRSALDEEVGQEELLLINATSIPLNQVHPLVTSFGGICYPAHIDKDSNSVLAILGSFPEDCGFTRLELVRPKIFFQRPDSGTILGNRKWLQSSDAHYLWDIAEPIRQLGEGDEDILDLLAAGPAL